MRQSDNPLLTRQINCLKSDDKLARRKALSSLRAQLEEGIPEDVLPLLLRPLLALLGDSSDSTRELSLSLLAQNVPLISAHPWALQEVFSSLQLHLPQERAEELRLQASQLLLCLPLQCPSLTALLLSDSFPPVRHVACALLLKLCSTAPHLIQQEGPSLLSALAPSLSHNHFKLRTTALHSLGAMVLCGNLVLDATPHLAQRFFDRHHSVREEATRVVGTWLLELGDRYSHFARLIPLMLTALSDEQEAVAELGRNLWHDVGLKFMRENEEDLKDRIDFLPSDATILIGDCEYRRPNVGCCELVQRHIGRILPALMSDLSDWLPSTRLKAAQLLPHLLLNAGDLITQHVELLLSLLLKMGTDDELLVLSKAHQSALMLGHFVSPHLWLDLVLSHLSKNSTSSLLPSTLSTMAAIVSTSLPFQSSVLFDSLISNQIAHSHDKSVQLSLLSLLESLVALFGDNVDVLNVLQQSLYVSALARDSAVRSRVGNLLDKLALVEGVETSAALLGKYSYRLIESLDSASLWTEESPAGRFFEAVLSESCSFDCLRMGLPLLEANLGVGSDPSLRLRLLNLISRLFTKLLRDGCDQFIPEEVLRVLQTLILPNVVWKAGRAAGAVRSAALVCLWILLSEGTVLDKMRGNVSHKICCNILSLMTSCLEDASSTSRLFAVRICGGLMALIKSSSESPEDDLLKLCDNLLKRLDDSEDSIRLETIHTFHLVFECLRQFDVGESRRCHFELLYRTLLLHMDDGDCGIQEGVCELLMAVGDVCPRVLEEELAKVGGRHRVACYCDRLERRLRQI